MVRPLERRISTAFLVTLLGLAVFRLFSHYNTVGLIESGRWAARSQKVEAELQALLSEVQEARVSQRDYLITRHQHRLRAYEEARGAAEAQAARLRELPEKTPEQAARFERLAGLVKTKLAVLDRLGSGGPEQAAGAASRAVADEGDSTTMAQILATVAEIQAEENDLFQSHVASVQTRARREFWISAVTAVIVVALLVFAYWLLLRYLAHRREAQAQIAALNERLQRKVTELETLYDVTPVGLVVAEDPDCKVIHGNAVMAKMLEVPAGANLSKTAPAGEQPAYRILHDGRELKPEELPMQVAAATGVTISNLELDLALSDRTMRLCTNVVPLLDGDGKPRGAVGAFWDIAEFKALQEKLIDERDAAAAEAAAKDELLATVSHDLRTPLAGTILLANLLRAEQKTQQEREELIEQIIQMCNAQSRLVEDILDVTRITHGKLLLQKRPVNLSDVVKAACDAVRPTAQAKDVRLTCDLPAGEALVTGDPWRLQQVFWNLLSNAVKFTPAGGRVEVTLRVGADGLEVRVADTGRGISPELLPHVFDRFWQGLRGGSPDGAGLGLGLAIAKHLVDLHGGRLWAESAGDGLGATFTVLLPAAATADRVSTASSGAA